MVDNLCNRCGKNMPVRPVETIFELGFRKEVVLLCLECAKETKENEKKIKEKYQKKMLDILNEYFRKVLK